jgi:hypothetical protein
MTLHISEDDSVEATALPVPLRAVPSSVAVRLIDRKGGLSLRTIGSNLSHPREIVEEIAGETCAT